MAVKWEELVESKYVYLIEDYYDEETELKIPAGTRCRVDKKADDEVLVTPTLKKYEEVEMYYYPSDMLDDIETERQYKNRNNPEGEVWKQIEKAVKRASQLKELSPDLEKIVEIVQNRKK